MQTTKQVLYHPNIRIFCSKCNLGETNASNNSALVQLKRFEFKPSSFTNGIHTDRQSNFNDNEMSTIAKIDSKIDLMYTVLKQVHDTVKETKVNLSSQVETSKSYSDVLKELKDVVKDTNVKLDDAKVDGGRSKSTTQLNGRSFPALGDSNKSAKRFRRDISPTPAPKSQLKHRNLVSGSSGNADHGLGDNVSVIKSKRTSPHAHLVKSIYISRLQPTVTVENITDYIKKKMPELKESDISLRMLVKKDQPLSELTYISYRLACTEEHYSKFMDPECWPAHIMIGEFIERERKPVKVADFMSTPSNIHQNTPITPKNASVVTPAVTEKTPLLMEINS